MRRFNMKYGSRESLHEIGGFTAFDHVLEYRIVCFRFRERVDGPSRSMYATGLIYLL